MTNKKPEDLQVGDVLCDMHDLAAFEQERTKPRIDSRRVDVVAHIKVPMRGGGTFILRHLQDVGGHRADYLNKTLVVVAEPHLDDPDDSFYVIRAAYSYDGRFFGLVEMQADRTETPT